MNQTKELILAPAIAATPNTAEMLPAAETIKKDLLARAEALIITRESSIEVRDQAIVLSGEMATHLKIVEADRESAGKPFYAIWKAINELAKKHSDPILAKQRTLNLGVGAVNDRLAAEDRAKQEALRQEQLKAEQERQAALDRQAELALAATPKSKKGAAAQLAKDLEAQEALEAAEEKQRQIDDERIRQAELARQSKPMTGTGAQRTEYDIEITDIKALYAAQPSCVRMEADKVQLKWLAHNRPELLPIPGVVITKRSVFSAKAK